MRLGASGFSATRVNAARILADRQTRAAVTRILEREAATVESHGAAYSEDELHRRPENRRTAESRAHGAHYHDSWAHSPVEVSGSVAQIKVGNTHPAARIVEGGSQAHEIAAVTAPTLAFPFNGGPPGAPSRKGGFAVAFGSGKVRTPPKVYHPGATAHRILYRAVVRWKSSSRLRR